MSNYKSILDVNEILNEYSEDIQEAMIKEAQEISKEGANKLKITSPKNTGKYSKGWKVKTIKGKNAISCIIYNTNPGLTQLLEKPHVIKNKYGEWGTTNPTPHIKPVEQECINKYNREVEKIIKNGG